MIRCTKYKKGGGLAEQWRCLFLLYLRLNILFPLTLLQVLSSSIHKTEMPRQFLHLHSYLNSKTCFSRPSCYLMETASAEDSQEFSIGAVALVKASQIYVDDDEIEVDVSEHDGGEQ